MSKMTEKLNKKGLHNNYNITSVGNPIVDLHTSVDSRDATVPAVTLSIKGKAFEGVSWYQHGSKWFTYMGVEQRKVAYQKAFDWIEKRFPGMKMVKSPFDRFAYVPEEDLKRALEHKEDQDDE